MATFKTIVIILGLCIVCGAIALMVFEACKFYWSFKRNQKNKHKPMPSLNEKEERYHNYVKSIEAGRGKTTSNPIMDAYQGNC